MKGLRNSVFMLLATHGFTVQSVGQVPPELPPFVPNQIIIEFLPGTPQSIRNDLFNLLDPMREEQRRFATTLHVLDFDENADLDSLIQRIERNSHVLFASRNAYGKLSEVFPDDPHFQSGEQWNAHNTGQSGGTIDVDLDAPAAWDNSTGSSTVTVAVIDTGVDATHEDLAANLLPGWNVADDNSDVSDTAGNSHGTAITGIISAVGNNSKGVAGVTWNTKILPIVWLTFNPDRTLRSGGTDADQADAVAYARSQGVKIVSVSSNFPDDFPMPATRSQIQQSSDTLFVYSAGNAALYTSAGANIVDETSNGTIYPCVYAEPNVVCVAAVKRDGNKPLFSNYGIKTVHLGAPGEEIFSTERGSTYGMPGPNSGGYPDGAGTSFAAPHVTGVVALMKALNPSYDWKKLKENVLLAAQPSPTGDLDGKTHTGRMVNADIAALAFGDSFDDGFEGISGTDPSFFFSNSTTGTRWGVAQSGSALCDPQVKTMTGTLDHTLEAKFSERAGEPGSNWTLASYKIAYPPGNDVQSLLIRINTADGSEFTGKSGRIGVGIIGESNQSSQACSSNGKTYDEISFAASMIGGIDVDTGEPFIYFDPPYTEFTYPAISLTGLTKLSINLFEGPGYASLYISDAITGEIIFQEEGIPYPGDWNWTGTDKPAIAYYGLSSGTSGTLHVRSFLSAR